MRLKVLALLAILGCWNVFAWGQNVNMWNDSWGPGFRHLRSVQILPDDKFIAIGGWESNDAISTIMTSTDTGLTWNLEMDNINAILQGLHFPSATTGYAVGWSGSIFKTTDAGDTWTAISIPGNPGNRNFNACHFWSNDIGIVVGGNQSNDSIQTILKTTDGGLNWSIKSDNLGFWLRSVQFVDANTVFAVGDGGVILKSTNGGDAWIAQSLVGSIANRNYTDVHFMDATTGVAVGGWPDNDSIQTIIRTTDGGMNWLVVTDNLGSMLQGVHFYSSTEGYAVGDDGVILFTNDGGVTWQNQNIPNNNTYGISDVFFRDAFFGITCGDEGKLLWYIDTTASDPIGTLTSPITLISETQVKIYGEINDYGVPAQVEFEYGTTMAFGTTVPMNPSSSSGAGFGLVNLMLNGLTPNEIYFGRMKLSNSIGTSYSNVVSFFTGLNAVPNHDFELWDSVNTDMIGGWINSGLLTQVNSHDGSIAVKLNTIDGDLGAIHYGQPDDNGNFQGGTPFTERPDSISFWANYDITLNDSALVILQLKNNGVYIVDTIFTIGGTSSGWENLAFKIDYQSAGLPDTMVLAFTNTNVFGGIVDLNSTITIDDVNFYGTSQNVPNNDMETWFVNTRHHAISWTSNDDDYSDAPYIIQKSTDAYSGDWAMKISNRVGGSNPQYARIKSGDDIYRWGPSFPIDFGHEHLFGYYQFSPNDGDTLFVSAIMFENGNQIGQGALKFHAPTSGYTLFDLPISYWSNTNADSCMIEFYINKDSLLNPGSSSALIDNLSFDAVISSVIEKPKLSFTKSEAVLFPNPTHGLVTIRFNDLKAELVELYVIDVQGQLVLRKEGKIFRNELELNLEGLSPNIYFVVVKNKNDIHTFKIQLR